jgi:hypothetical protein
MPYTLTNRFQRSPDGKILKDYGRPRYENKPDTTLENKLLKPLYEKMERSIGDLEILPQWVIWEPTGAQQLQVFTAAPSYQGMRSSITPTGTKLCELLVATQYGCYCQDRVY